MFSDKVRIDRKQINDHLAHLPYLLNLTPQYAENVLIELSCLGILVGKKRKNSTNKRSCEEIGQRQTFKISLKIV